MMSVSTGLYLFLLLGHVVLAQNGTTTTPPATTTTARPWFFQSFFNAGANILRAKLNAVQSVVNGGLRALNSSVALGTGLASSTSSSLTSAGRGFVNSVAGLKSGALQSGANITRQGLGMLGSMAAPIPLFGSMVQMGVGAGQFGVDMMNSLGQAGISTMQTIKNAKLSAIDSAIQGGANAIQSITNMKVNMVQNQMNSTANAVNAALGRPRPTTPTAPTTSASPTTPTAPTTSASPTTPTAPTTSASPTTPTTPTTPRTNATNAG